MYRCQSLVQPPIGPERARKDGAGPGDGGSPCGRDPLKLPWLTPAELLDALQARGFNWLKSPRGLAGLMAPLGLVAKRAREGPRVVRRYLLEPGALADLAVRYNPAADVADEPAAARLASRNRQQPATSGTTP
jgi:hypothetical protein